MSEKQYDANGVSYLGWQEVEEKYRLVQLAIAPVIQQALAGNDTDLIEHLVPENAHKFEKIPVWTCWFQGFDQAPEVIQMCRKRMHEVLDSEIYEIIELDADNISEFVTFPDWLLDKVAQEKVSLTHLSDVLRMTLLYYYGGFWVDATCFFSEDILPKNPREMDYFGIRLKGFNAPSASEGKWVSCFLYSKKGGKLPQFVMNAYYYYFLTNDELIDYFVQDYFIRIAYDLFPEVKSAIDRMPESHPIFFYFAYYKNEPYTEELWKEISKKNPLFKMSYKYDYEEYTENGTETMIGHLLHSFL